MEPVFAGGEARPTGRGRRETGGVRGACLAAQEQEPRRESGTPQRVPTGASVLVLSGFFEGLELPIDRDWLVIGRGRQAGLVLPEPTISRAHAALGFDGTAFFVQDLQSTNGTMVNGEQRDRAPLRDHDEIQIGRLQLQVRISPRRAGAA